MIKNYNKNVKKTKVVILCGGLGSGLLKRQKSDLSQWSRSANYQFLSHIINFYSKVGYKRFYFSAWL